MREKGYITVFLLIIVVFGLALPLSALSAAEIIVELPGRKEINSPQIMLGDIADISAAEEDREKLAAIELESFTDLEREIEVSRRLVELHIRNAGYNYDDFEVIGAPEVQVEAATRTLNRETLNSTVKNEIKRYFQEKHADSSIEIETRVVIQETPEEVLIPDGSWQIKLPRSNYSSGGIVSQPVGIHVDGEEWERLYLRLNINHELTAYKLIEDVSRGEKVTDSVLEKTSTKVRTLPEKLVTDLDEKLVREGVFRRSYNSGDLLSLSMLELPVLINRGDEVTARIQVGNVKVHIDMIARDRGKSGEIITLENKSSGERVNGKILNENMVEIIN